MGTHKYTHGTLLSPCEAQELFGVAYDPTAQYKACHGAVRRIVDQSEGRDWFVTVEPCSRGHHDVILVKANRKGFYCAGCKREAKQRAKRRKMLATTSFGLA